MRAGRPKSCQNRHLSAIIAVSRLGELGWGIESANNLMPTLLSRFGDVWLNPILSRRTSFAQGALCLMLKR